MNFTDEELELISEALDHYAANHGLAQPDYNMYVSLIQRIDDRLNE